MKTVKQIVEEERQEKLNKLINAQRDFAASVQCQMECGDGSGRKPERHVENCPMLEVLHIEESKQ